LEDARSDLHETNCKDHSVIHELTFNNRQLLLSEASLRDRLAASDDQLRQLRAELDSSVQRIAQLETSLQRARDTETYLTDQCGHLEAELSDWKCRLDDALQLLESKETELRQAAAEHLVEVDRWNGKVDELMTANSDVEASEARTKQDLLDSQATESLLRKKMEELNRQLSHHEKSAAQTRDQLSSQLSAVQERLVQLESCLESKELERAELEKSCAGVQSVLSQVQEEKSQLLMTLTDVRKDRNDARDEVRTLNEAMAGLQDRLLSSANKCSVLEDWLGEVNGKNDAVEQLWNSRLETVEAEKRQLYNQIMQLENDVSWFQLVRRTPTTLSKINSFGPGRHVLKTTLVVLLVVVVISSLKSLRLS